MCPLCLNVKQSGVKQSHDSSLNWNQRCQVMEVWIDNNNDENICISQCFIHFIDSCVFSAGVQDSSQVRTGERNHIMKSALWWRGKGGLVIAIWSFESLSSSSTGPLLTSQSHESKPGLDASLLAPINTLQMVPQLNTAHLQYIWNKAH